jgi:hypothetical protein
MYSLFDMGFKYNDAMHALFNSFGNFAVLVILSVKRENIVKNTGVSVANTSEKYRKQHCCP